ncbi:hypothetical protein ACE6H2_003236 [Prunus campanulata]
MLLSRSSSRRRDPPIQSLQQKAPAPVQRHSLKDLFVSSPPFELNEKRKSEIDTRQELGLVVAGKAVGGFGPGSPRPGWTGFRYKSSLGTLVDAFSSYPVSSLNYQARQRKGPSS